MSRSNLISFTDHRFLKSSQQHNTLNDEFHFCTNGNMVFHWADFFETCEFMKREIEENLSLRDDFSRRETGIERLKLIPIWISSQNQVYQLSMYDLYENYLLTKGHLVQNVDPNLPVEISFISGTGPFKSMAIAECFSHITYKDFVMYFLLKDKLPKRDFRVRLKSKILMEYGEAFSQARLVNLEQLTSKGLLVSLDWGLWMEEISMSQELRILIETNHIESALGKKFEELKTHLNQHTFNLFYSSSEEDAITLSLNQIVVQSSFEFLKNRKVYLYIGFEKMRKSVPHKTKVLEEFINYSKEIVKNHFF